MRASDADRDQVAEVLREAAAEGRITLAELEERLERTYASQTYDELAPVTADLPSAGGSGPLAASGPAQPDAVRPLRVQDTMSNVVRKGRWRVPAQLSVANPGGNTRLDFREAEFVAATADLEINCNWGNALLILPPGMSAEVDVETSWMGTLRNSVDEVPTPGSPHLRVTGQCKAGVLHLRYRRVKGRRS